MKTFLIGHRGTGKSTFLRKIQQRKPHSLCIDLDAYIEEHEHRSIKEIFSRSGEPAFRVLEKKYFDQIMANLHQTQELYLALGAGFDTSLIQEARCVWISRASDFSGRVFLDRPQLGEAPSHPKEALQSYFSTMKFRHPHFLKHCRHDFLCLQEGGIANIDLDLFLGTATLEGASHTLTPDILMLDPSDLHSYCKRLVNLNFDFFEVRSDLFSQEQMKILWDYFPHEKLLLSLRTEGVNLGLFSDLKNLDIDSAIFDSYTLPQTLQFKILSSHNAQAPHKLPGFHLKWAPVLKSISEVYSVWNWQAEDPTNRSLLLRSSDPSVSFASFRLLLKNKQKLNFVKERSFEFTDALVLGNHDQPTASQWLRWNATFSSFAAILGNPVTHSWSPGFHFDFFYERNMNFASFTLSNDEFKNELAFLIDLGLKAAAVTSPFKTNLFELGTKRASLAMDLQSANTLFIHPNGELEVWNTDFGGLDFQLRGFEHLPCAIVGGGGTKAALKKILPYATCYSARSLERNAGVERGQYSLVIWAAGGKIEDINPSFLPHSCLNCRYFMDLDYRDSSTGRAIASFLKQMPGNASLKYISGHKMFLKQAKAQQEIWKQWLH